MLSVSLTPDWTVTSTVPTPLGTSTESCVSLSTVTELAATLPKSTESCPAAPEKFWPLTMIVLLAAPLVALRPVTIGRQVDDLEVAGGQHRQPVAGEDVVHVPGQGDALLASCEADEPVTYIALPMSASTRPYFCMAWAMICDSGGMRA